MKSKLTYFCLIIQMRHITLLALVVVFHSAIAQTTYPLSGKLKSKDTKEAIVGATVFIINQDSTLAGAAISDEDGTFSVKLSRGEYTIKINFLGMAPYNETLRFHRDEYLGTIYLETSSEEIEGVEIKERAAQATVQGDTTSYSSKAYKTNQNASAKDLIEKMPGMQDDNGDIKAQGEKVQQVLVDGKSFFGQDPKAALNTLPAEVVDKIQVFDDQSEQSKASGIDDGTRIKTINIVTKINMRNGEFGKVYAGGGTDSRYAAGGNINKFKGDQRISILGQVNNINQQNFATEDLLGVVGDNSGGRRGGGHGPGAKRPSFLQGFSAGSSANDFMVSPSGGLTNTIAGGINYQDAWGKKVEVSSSYFYNNAQTESVVNTFQNFYLTEISNQQYNELDSSNSTNVNHKLNAKLVYKINEKASLYYIPSVSIQQNEGTSLLNGNTSQEAVVINALNQSLTSDLTALKVSNNLMFRLNGEKRGRSLFMQVQSDYDMNSGDKYLNSSNQTPDTIDVINQLGVLDETTIGWSGSIMYSEPLGDKGLGGMLTYDISNSGISALTNTNSNAIGGVGGYLDSSLSSNYTNDWTMHKPGIGFRKFSKAGGFVVKLNYEIAQLSNNQVIPQESIVNKTFSSVQPFAIYRKRFENNSSWFTMYRTYTTKPEASQLTEAIDNSNPLQVSTGNSDLNQQYGHWIMSKYNNANVKKSTVFYAMINGGFAQNYIGQNTFTARNDTVINGVSLSQGSQMYSPVNLDGQFQSNAFMTYGFPIKKLKSNLNLNASTGVSNVPSLINGRSSNTFNQTYGLGVVLSSNISEKVDFTISTESTYSLSSNSLNTSLNTQYLIQTSKLKYDWIMPKGFTFRTQLQHQQYYGLSDFLDNSVLLWTAGIGKQVFKNERGEIQLSMYDILGQNNNIAQNFYDSYYEETTSNVLTRYVMLSFSYNIRKFRESKDDADIKTVE